MATKTDAKREERQLREETVCGDVRFTPSAPTSPASHGGPANATDRQQPALGPSEIREPRANALKHGLTATTLLSRVVQAERLDQWVADLRAEYRRRTITEELLIREIARHASALEITEQAEPAVMRQAMFAIEQLVIADDPQTEDHRLAVAVTGETLDRCARYRRAHEKALHQALDKLRLFRAAATSPAPGAEGAVDHFASTEACELYLRRHLLTANWRCPACESEQGHWLQRRKVWECARCAKQTGLRFGTVFEHSPLPLTTWFSAIRIYASQTDVRAEDLAEKVGIQRLGTARSMLVRIRRAVGEEDLERGLAGLLAQPLVE
jgi:transposase-like protein